MNFDLEDRELAAVTLGVTLLLAVPLIVLAACGLGLAWMALVGIGDAHGKALGWASETYRDKQGHKVYEIGTLIPAYMLSVFTAYLFYQGCELAYASFKAFRRALA